jgi:hypothetical protein
VGTAAQAARSRAPCRRVAPCMCAVGGRHIARRVTRLGAFVVRFETTRAARDAVRHLHSELGVPSPRPQCMDAIFVLVKHNRQSDMSSATAVRTSAHRLAGLARALPLVAGGRCAVGPAPVVRLRAGAAWAVGPRFACRLPPPRPGRGRRGPDLDLDAGRAVLRGWSSSWTWSWTEAPRYTYRYSRRDLRHGTRRTRS